MTWRAGGRAVELVGGLMGGRVGGSTCLPTFPRTQLRLSSRPHAYQPHPHGRVSFLNKKSISNMRPNDFNEAATTKFICISVKI